MSTDPLIPPTSDPRGGAAAGGPARRTVLAVSALVLVVTACLFYYGIGRWPWDHDEVESLMEMGLLHYPVPADSQIARLGRAIPVWHTLQRLALCVLPISEGGTRVLSATLGVLAVLAAFWFALRHRGLWFAAALAILMDGSQMLIWLSQQNRFYPAALLALTLALMAIWSRAGGWWTVALAGLLGVLAVLTHTLTLVVLGIGLVAALIGYPLGWASRAVLARSAAAALAAAAVYLGYSRPILGHWISGDVGETNVLVSLVAQIGIPTAALVALSLVLAAADRGHRRAMAWWCLVLLGGLMFVALAPRLLGQWNPRYAILFAPPFWVLGAYAMEHVAGRLDGRLLRVAWYGAVILLLLPKLASHYVDGSRHDLRQAAAVVRAAGLDRGPMACNWPLTLQYYLPERRPGSILDWQKGQPLPKGETVVVYATNLWDPPLSLPDRQVEVLAQIARRRFDEQSHVTWVFRVGPAGPTAAGPAATHQEQATTRHNARKGTMPRRALRRL